MIIPTIKSTIPIVIRMIMSVLEIIWIMNFSRYNNYIKINPANTGATKKRLFHSHHIFCLLSPLHFSQNISHASWSISNNHQQIGLEIPFDKFLLRLAAVFKTPPQQFSKLCSYGFFSVHFFLYGRIQWPCCFPAVPCQQRPFLRFTNFRRSPTIRLQLWPPAKTA